MLYAESNVNATEDAMTGPERVLEAPRKDTPGALFSQLQAENGRCTGHVYIDRNGDSVPVGWVFEKRKEYVDAKETYLHRTWITVLEPTEDGDRPKRIA